MRRKDREVTDPERIDAIIRACHCCRLGFYDNGEVYIVPLDFGYDEKEGKRTFYFHGAKEGRKMDCILRLPPGRVRTGYRLRAHRGGGRVQELRRLPERRRDGARLGHRGPGGKAGRLAGGHAPQHGKGRLGFPRRDAQRGLCFSAGGGDPLLQGTRINKISNRKQRKKQWMLLQRHASSERRFSRTSGISASWWRSR